MHCECWHLQHTQRVQLTKHEQQHQKDLQKQHYTQQENKYQKRLNFEEIFQPFLLLIIKILKQVYQHQIFFVSNDNI